MLGNGHYVKEGGHLGTTYYTDGGRTLVLAFVYGVDWSVDEISLDEFKDQAAKFPAQAVSPKVSRTLALEPGIGLGTPVSRILNRYGRPTRDGMRRGTRVIEYETDLSVTRDVLVYTLRFFCRGDRVVGFSIYNGE